MSCHQISRPGQIFGALSMSQVSVQKTSQRTREKRGKGMISNWEVLRKTKQWFAVRFWMFFCWISNEQLCLEGFLCSWRKPSKYLFEKTTPDSKLKTKKFDPPIQVLAAALISSLSFVGLGLAGATEENQRKSRWRTGNISGGGNSKIFYFHPENWGRSSNLTNIFQMGWNHQLVNFGRVTPLPPPPIPRRLLGGSIPASNR